MEDKCVNSLCVLDFCFSNRGAKPNRWERDGEDIENGKLWWKGFQERGRAITKAQRKEKRCFKLSQPLFPMISIIFPTPSQSYSEDLHNGT